MSEYISKAIPTKITATSRIALKVRDNFYTVEYSEERTLPAEATDVDIAQERNLLWQTTNDMVDNQAQDILTLLNNNK